jgi:protein TonB
VPDDELLDEEDLALDASLDLTVALDVPPPPPPAEDEAGEEEDLDEIFVAVEQMPEIIGGVEHLQSLVDYPEIARKAQMEGMVVVRVLVNLDGSPSDPEVIRSAGAALDKAAVEAVMKLEFKPGRQRNRPVRTLMAIPVRFQLS